MVVIDTKDLGQLLNTAHKHKRETILSLCCIMVYYSELWEMYSMTTQVLHYQSC